MGKRSCIAALCSFSVSTASQTNRPASALSDSSVKTNAFIERQVCHQGAHASMKRGSFFAFASARARG